MKIKNASHLRLTGILLGCLILGIQGLKSQNAAVSTTQGESEKQVGSGLRTEDIISKADAIFVGKVTDVGHEVLSSSPMAPSVGPLYNGVKVEVVQILRGSVGSQISVSFGANFAEHENLPVNGSSYVFFVIKNGNVDADNPDQFAVLKLLPATGDNITKVKALIAAAPTGK